MKKIFTLSLLCLLSVAAAKAQLKITNGTQEVTNGSVLTFTATEIAEIGLVDCAPSDPKITNVSGEKGTLKVVFKKNSLFDSFDWCGITAQCQPMKSGTETRRLPDVGVARQLHIRHLCHLFCHRYGLFQR